MQAVILAGGASIGLEPITIQRPKVLVNLLNKSILQRTLESLPESIDKVIVTCDYRVDDIKNFVNQHRKEFSQSIEVVTEDRKLGSAGAIKNVEKQLDDEFLIISGDVVSSIDFQKFIDFHHNKKSDFSIALFSLPNPMDYGLIGLDNNQKVNRFSEKPKSDLVFSTLVSTGVYLSNKKILEFIPRLSFYDIATDLMMYILKRGLEVYGYQFSGYWVDIGRPQRLLDAHKAMLNRTMEFMVEGEVDARLLPPLVIGKQCKINGIIGPGVSMGDRIICADAKISDSVIYSDVKTGSRVIIKDSIICSGCQIGNDVIIEGAVLADGCKISNGVKVARDARIWPSQKITKDVGEGMMVGAPPNWKP